MKDAEGVEVTKFLTYKEYVSMGTNSVKNSSIKNPKPHAYIHIIGRKSTKLPMNTKKDVEGVEETRFLTNKVYVSMGYVKNSHIEIPKPHAHLHIIGRKSHNFNEFDERCRRSCGNKIMVGKV